MNSVFLIGNLTTDVELRELGAEKQLAKFGLAVDRGGKDSETDFFRISAWDRQAQLCADYLAKGRKIALEGRRLRRGGGAVRGRCLRRRLRCLLEAARASPGRPS